MCHDVPYKTYTRLRKYDLVEGAVGMLDYFPYNNVFYDKVIPSMISEGKGK